MDETDWEAEGRFARAWAALVDPVIAGRDSDGIGGLVGSPFHWRGQDAWGLAGLGRAPDIIQGYVSQLLQQREPHSFIGVEGLEGEISPKEMRGFENHGLAEIRYVAQAATMCREWQEPVLHDWRWLSDCLSPELVNHEFAMNILGIRRPFAGSRPLEEQQKEFEDMLDQVLERIHSERRQFGKERFDSAVADSRDSRVSELIQWRGRIEKEELNGFAAWQDEMKAHCQIVYVPDPSSGEDFRLDVRSWDLLYHPDELLPVVPGAVNLLAEKRSEFKSNFGAVSLMNRETYWPELYDQALINQGMATDLEERRKKERWNYV